jgi:hypothetical protein
MLAMHYYDAAGRAAYLAALHGLTRKLARMEASLLLDPSNRDRRGDDDGRCRR